MKNPKYSRAFARYSVLSVLGTLGVSCYILADTFFVAQGLGTDGLTALNLAIPVYNLIHGSGLMLGMGGATLFSVALGKQERNANRIYTQTLCLAAVFSAFFFLLDYIFIFPLQIDIFGAVFATGLSPVISILVMTPHWIHRKAVRLGNGIIHCIKRRAFALV